MDVKYAVIGALIVLTTVNGAPYKEAPTCGYQVTTLSEYTLCLL